MRGGAGGGDEGAREALGRGGERGAGDPPPPPPPGQRLPCRLLAHARRTSRALALDQSAAHEPAAAAGSGGAAAQPSATESKPPSSAAPSSHKVEVGPRPPASLEKLTRRPSGETRRRAVAGAAAGAS